MKPTSKHSAKEPAVDVFDALPNVEKERIYRQIDANSERLWRESKRPTAREQARLNRIARKIGPGRPKLGKGTRVVSVTVEKDLLQKADDYADRAGLKRSEVFSQALRGMLKRRAS